VADVTSARIDELESFEGFAVFRRARAGLGVSSFGMSIIDMPPNATEYPEHDHRSDGQEEVYVALAGSGVLEVEGERHVLDADHIVRVGPAARRKILPGDDGLRLLALGGVPGQAYEPPKPA
jgi:mannose-6-phosphate isomerase-like protein (cupin superfamily)